MTVELYETSMSTEKPHLVYQSVINDGIIQLKHLRLCQSDKTQEKQTAETKITEGTDKLDQSDRNKEQPKLDLSVK